MVQDLLAQQQSLMNQLSSGPKVPSLQKNSQNVPHTVKRQSLQKKASERVPRVEKVSFGVKTEGATPNVN